MNKSLITAFILTAAAFVFYVAVITSMPPREGNAFVSRVIDGYTVELSTKERVRLLGINTPEKGQYLFKESTNYLKSLVENKTVFLEADKVDKDKYNRSLRHIFVGNVFVNVELVRLGYAVAYIIPPNEKYSGQITAVEAWAREAGLGVWKVKIKDAFCIGIYEFRYNAAGNDNENLNGEYVVFRNSCNYTMNLDGWTLKDRDRNEYRFSNFTAEGKRTFSLHSGHGAGNETDLYWEKGRAVWNNDGDRLVLSDAESNVMVDYSYE